MKSCRDLEPLLDDFVDGNTTTGEARQVAQHLAGCPECRGIVERTRALLAATARLDREILPGEDLWPGIRTAVRPRQVERPAAAFAWTGAGARWIGLAASLLVVVLAGSTALWLRDGGGDGTPVTGSPRGGALPAAHVQAASIDEEVREYVEAAELLLTSIRERGSRFSPETLAVLEKNLEIIDQAITEVRGVLASDLADRGNAMILQAMHQQKVELLRRVSRLSS